MKWIFWKVKVAGNALGRFDRKHQVIMLQEEVAIKSIFVLEYLSGTGVPSKYPESCKRSLSDLTGIRSSV